MSNRNNRTTPQNPAQAETTQERLTRRLLQQTVGDRNTITLHKFVIDLCDGDHLKALLVEQLMYWSERSRSDAGEVAKSDADWHDELRLSPRQMRRIREWLTKSGLCTIQRKRSPFYSGQPVYHYVLNWKVVQRLITAQIHAQISESESSELNEPASSEVNVPSSSEPDEPVSSFTEPTPEPIQSMPDAIAPAQNGTKAPAKPRKRNAMFDAIVEAFQYDADGLTKNEASLIGTVAAQLTAAQVMPDEVPALYAWCKRQNWKSWGPGALTTNVSNWRKTAKPRPVTHPASDWETFA